MTLFFLYFIIFASTWILLCVSVQPTRTCSINLRPLTVFSLKLHSVSQQVGSNQTHKRTQVRRGSWRRLTRPIKKNNTTFPVFVWGVEKHSQRVTFTATMKNKQQEKYVQNSERGPFGGLFLMLTLCPCTTADPWSAGLIFKWQVFLSRTAMTSWSWSSYVAEWCNEIPTFLHSWRVIGQYAWLQRWALRRRSLWQEWKWRACKPARL